jgi:hypothetical protein
LACPLSLSTPHPPDLGIYLKDARSDSNGDRKDDCRLKDGDELVEGVSGAFHLMLPWARMELHRLKALRGASSSS